MQYKSLRISISIYDCITLPVIDFSFYVALAAIPDLNYEIRTEMRVVISLSSPLVTLSHSQWHKPKKRWATFQAGLWAWLIFIEKQLKGSTLESYHSTLLPNVCKIYWQVPLSAGPCPLKTFLASRILALNRCQFAFKPNRSELLPSG